MAFPSILGLIVGIVILIVVISSIALIYNSFAISISERSGPILGRFPALVQPPGKTAFCVV